MPHLRDDRYDAEPQAETASFAAAVGRAVAVTPDLAADSVSDLLDLLRVLPRIDDFPVLSRRAALDGSRL